MAVRLIDNTPSYILVDWACQVGLRLHMPADRPWYQAPPPPFAAATWEVQCHCRKEPVRVQRYRCSDGQGSVYLGQCGRCQAIVWAYRPELGEACG